MRYNVKIIISLLVFIISIQAIFLYVCNYSEDGDNIITKKKTLLSAIKKKKRLDVVILNSPTTYYIGNEEAIGFEYELISEFAKNIGVDLNLTIVHTIGEALQMSRENVGDITVAGLTITDERKKEFKFGPQYNTVQEQLICNDKLYKTTTFPQDVQDMVGLNMTVGKDTSYEFTLNQIKKDVEDLNFSTSAEYSTEHLLEMTQNGELDCTVADSSVFMINQRYYPKLIRALVLSERKSLAWIIRDGDDSLNEVLYKWLNSFERSGKMAELKDHYFTYLSIFDYYDTSVFYSRLESRLPKYKKYFVEAGEKYEIPWMILAAQSYQESYWNPKAVSNTGVRGMMMLTNQTAKSLGVKDRVDVEQSIDGGAKYLQTLEKMMPEEIKGKNRWAFALASYNVGYGHILDAQTLARKLDINPNSWLDLKEVLPLLTQSKYFKTLKYGYARGYEPVKYVDAIQNYYYIIEKNEMKNEQLNAEKKKLEEVEKKLAEAQEKIKAAHDRAKETLRKRNKGKTSLKLLPKNKTWIGYVDMATKKKFQTFTTQALVIDPKKDWLLLFGAGKITLEVNHAIKEYSSTQNMRFKYVNGTLTKITVQEFMKLNDGKKW